MTIPKRIFYVWGANEPKRPDVELCIKTWKYANPDYEIIEINENSTEYFNFQEELKRNKWFKTVYDRKMYAYVSDYVRVKVLYDNGGIYLDTDVTTVKSFDKFLNEPAFVGLQSEEYVEPAILGAEKGNEFLEQITEFYEEHIWEKPIYAIPQIFSYFLKKLLGVSLNEPRTTQKILHYDSITIYPEEYFIPFRYNEKFFPKCIKENTHTIHWFSSSWVNPSNLFFLKNKHVLPLESIDREYDVSAKQFQKNNFFENIFSIKNTIYRTHKVITFLWIKFKYPRKGYNATNS